MTVTHCLVRNIINTVYSEQNYIKNQYIIYKILSK